MVELNAEIADKQTITDATTGATATETTFVVKMPQKIMTLNIN